MPTVHQRVLALASHQVPPRKLPQLVGPVVQVLAEPYGTATAAWGAVTQAADRLQRISAALPSKAFEAPFEAWCRMVLDVASYHPERIAGLSQATITERENFRKRIASAITTLQQALEVKPDLPLRHTHVEALRDVAAALLGARPTGHHQRTAAHPRRRPDFAAPIYADLLAHRRRRHEHVIPAVWSFVKSLVSLCDHHELGMKIPFQVGVDLLNLAKVTPIKGAVWTESAVRNLYYKHSVIGEMLNRADNEEPALASPAPLKRRGVSSKARSKKRHRNRRSPPRRVDT